MRLGSFMKALFNPKRPADGWSQVNLTKEEIYSVYGQLCPDVGEFWDFALFY